MITSVEEMIVQYVSAWNESQLEDYQKEFGKCWAEDALYSDPYGEYRGLDELANFAYKSLKIMPSREFSIFEKPEFHHHYGRYAWKVEVSGFTNTGYDYFAFNTDFQLTSLISFFNLPADYPIDQLG